MLLSSSSRRVFMFTTATSTGEIFKMQSVTGEFQLLGLPLERRCSDIPTPRLNTEQQISLIKRRKLRAVRRVRLSVPLGSS